MKCKFCGAEIKKGSNVCEYCGSEVQGAASGIRPGIKNSEKPSKNIIKTIARVIIALAAIWAVTMVISTIAVLNSDAFKHIYESTSMDDASGMPRGETGLTGRIVSCDETGTASIKYEGDIYENVKILDKALIDWVNDTDRSLDLVEIRFATDEKGNICELGLSSDNFFVMKKEENRYIGIRTGKVISFTSPVPLEEGRCYSGYFSYPDVRLYWAKENIFMARTFFDPQCSKKESMIEQEPYTEEDITVYRILVEGRWYYCCEETYDAIQAGDLLNEYKMYDVDGLAYLAAE